MSGALACAEGGIRPTRAVEEKPLNESVKAVPSANPLPLRLAGRARAPMALLLEQGSGEEDSLSPPRGVQEDPKSPEISPSSLAGCEFSLHLVILLGDLCSRHVAPLSALGVGSARFPLPSQPVCQGPTFLVVTK